MQSLAQLAGTVSHDEAQVARVNEVRNLVDACHQLNQQS